MDTYLNSGSGVPEVDEDFPYFLDELALLLNKYHYGFEKVKMLKFTDPSIKIVEFKGDGQYLYPMAEVSRKLLDKGEDSE